jgi:hypothetical protein
MPRKFNLLSLKVEAGPDADTEEHHNLVRRLRKELLALTELASVEAPPAPPVPQSKAAGIDWQTLIVTLAASGGVLTSLISMLKGWLVRQEQTSITLEIDGDKLIVTGASSAAEKRLVNDWIRRHQGA